MIKTNTFKEVMGSFCSGVTVITMKGAHKGYHGLTVSSFASVSLDPPLVLFSRKNTNNVQKALVVGDRIVINILSRDQKELAYRFANPKLDNEARFDQVDYELSNGVPILQGSKSAIEADVYDYFDSGDHTIFVCEAKQLHFNKALEPLVYFGGSFYDLLSSTSPV